MQLCVESVLLSVSRPSPVASESTRRIRQRNQRHKNEISSRYVEHREWKEKKNIVGRMFKSIRIRYIIRNIRLNNSLLFFWYNINGNNHVANNLCLNESRRKSKVKSSISQSEFANLIPIHADIYYKVRITFVKCLIRANISLGSSGRSTRSTRIPCIGQKGIYVQSCLQCI